MEYTNFRGSSARCIIDECMKWLFSIIGIAALVAGCMSSVKVDKRPNLALPIYDSSSNIVEYVQIDQGYSVRYMRLGFSTEI